MKPFGRRRANCRLIRCATTEVAREDLHIFTMSTTLMEVAQAMVKPPFPVGLLQIRPAPKTRPYTRDVLIHGNLLTPRQGLENKHSSHIAPFSRLAKRLLLSRGLEFEGGPASLPPPDSLCLGLCRSPQLQMMKANRSHPPVKAGALAKQNLDSD